MRSALAAELSDRLGKDAIVSWKQYLPLPSTLSSTYISHRDIDPLIISPLLVPFELHR